MRRLICLFRRHEWVEGQDPVTQHPTRHCGRCGTYRSYSADQRGNPDDKYRAPRDETDFTSQGPYGISG